MLGSNPRPVWICLLKNVLKETTGFAQVTTAGGGSHAPNMIEVPFETRHKEHFHGSATGNFFRV